MNKAFKNPEFVKRMVVDAENTADIREKFFNGQEITPEEIKGILSITPRHKDINWGPNRLTMIPWSGLEHLHECIKDTVKKNIEGDFIETGIWRGGTCIVAKAVYEDLGANKKIFAADSFEGLPKPNAEKYPDDKGDTHYLDDMMKVSLEAVKENFKKFDLLDDQVIFLKGWFKDTLPKALIGKISILRLDGDMYESTIDVLENVYHKLSIGGYCIIDDYHHKGCRMAIYDFRYRNGITEHIIKIDNDPRSEIHFWVKKKDFVPVHGNYPGGGLFRNLYVFKNELKFYGKKIILKTLYAIKRAVNPLY